jgi:hypothetical protein
MRETSTSTRKGKRDFGTKNHHVIRSLPWSARAAERPHDFARIDVLALNRL